MVETTHKDIKIKAVMKLYYNPDPSMEAVRLFKEKSVSEGCTQLSRTQEGMQRSSEFTSN